MGIKDSLAARRTVYALNRDLPQGVDGDRVVALVRDVTGLVPDAFNMHSQRAVVVLGEAQDRLWDAVFDAFGGKVAREKVDGFKAAAGTVLYFIDDDVVSSMQGQFPRYAENFPVWAQQSNGMLQISVWSALRELGLGANLQHYNPVIDDAVREVTGVPASWHLVAQMPFGGIAAQPDPKPVEDVDLRVKVVR
ncbi:MAG: nitroreductase family protein [Coriobacteriales bacterium]|jgi:predicted oxidoreductase (fatty acid repression mutant protein)